MKKKLKDMKLILKEDYIVVIKVLFYTVWNFHSGKCGRGVIFLNNAVIIHGENDEKKVSLVRNLWVVWIIVNYCWRKLFRLNVLVTSTGNMFVPRICRHFWDKLNNRDFHFLKMFFTVSIASLCLVSLVLGVQQLALVVGDVRPLLH